MNDKRRRDLDGGAHNTRPHNERKAKTNRRLRRRIRRILRGEGPARRL